jgi:hypothetical protein
MNLMGQKLIILFRRSLKTFEIVKGNAFFFNGHFKTLESVVGKWGKTHDRLILKTILQKNTVLKLMSYTALSLLETSSSQKLFCGIFFSVSWHFDVAVYYLLELVSCRDELQAYFLIPSHSGANTVI